MRTLLKWPGNKRRVMEQIRPHLDWNGVQRWVEPFAGALGATLTADIPEGVEIRLSDAFPLLEITYDRFLQDPQGLEADVNSLPSSREDFMRIREQVPAETRWAAAWLLYINKRSFSGLLRFNRQGKCTSTWNQSTRPIRLEGLGHVTDLLQRSGGVQTSDWRGPVSECGPGDLLFIDPPYIVPGRKEWAGYGGGSFTWDDHVELERECWAAAERGARVITCNSWCPEAMALWHRWIQFELLRGWNLRGDSGSASELLCLSP